VYASLEEIRSVHEMHPDYRISDAIDENFEASTSGKSRYINENSRAGSLRRPNVELDNSLRAFNSDGWTRDGQPNSVPSLVGGSKATFHQESHHDDRAVSQGGLDYYDTGKDLESRGVIDEDGECITHSLQSSFTVKLIMKAMILNFISL
jgi:hypothetical protein